jgi:hypothetical protein
LGALPDHLVLARARRLPVNANPRVSPPLPPCVLQDVIVQKPVGSGGTRDLLFQRAAQVALGVWLVLLGWRASESGEDAGEPVGDGGGDRVSVP